MIWQQNIQYLSGSTTELRQTTKKNILTCPNNDNSSMCMASILVIPTFFEGSLQF